MAATAEKLPPQPVIRRFQLPDISTHAWIMKRLLEMWPHLNEHTLFGFLRGVITSSEYLFLYQDHAVALAYATALNPLSSRGMVQEIFVLAESPEYVPEAASMYPEIARWAKNRQIDTILVQELSDVPHETIKDRLGRIFTRQQHFARI